MQSSINKDKNKNKIIYFFNTRLARFVLVEVRAFTVVVLKNLAFSTSKGYFICFTTKEPKNHVLLKKLKINFLQL